MRYMTDKKINQNRSKCFDGKLVKNSVKQPSLALITSTWDSIVSKKARRTPVKGLLMSILTINSIFWIQV